MSQINYSIPDAPGAAFLANLNSVLDAIGTTNKGPNRPATIGAGMLWLDDNTPSSTLWTLNLYDGSEDIPLVLIDTTTNMASVRVASIGVNTADPIRALTVSSNTAAEVALQDTSRPANQRNARMVYSGGKFSIAALNDAGDAGAGYFNYDPLSGHTYFGLQTGVFNPGISNTTLGAVMFNDGGNGNALILSRAADSPLFLNLNTDSIITSYRRSGTQVGSVNVTPTSTLYSTSSDKRKKTYIKPYKDSGQIIDALNVVSHGWRGKPEGGKAVGLIAQEAHEVFPAAVFKGDEDETLKEGDEGFRGWEVGYSTFVPLLLAEAKALRVRVAAVEELAGQVPGLLSRIEALEAASRGKS